MADTWPVRPVFKLVRNVDVSILVYILVQYIPTDTVGIGTVLTTLELNHKYLIQLLKTLSVELIGTHNYNFYSDDCSLASNYDYIYIYIYWRLR